MARPLRIEYSGAIYHVTCRGNERKDIFRDNGDRKRLRSKVQKGNVLKRLLSRIEEKLSMIKN